MNEQTLDALVCIGLKVDIAKYKTLSAFYTQISENFK